MKPTKERASLAAPKRRAPPAPWQEHPAAFWSVLVAALVPGTLLVVAAGFVLQAVAPEPGATAVLLGLLAMVALFVLGMLLGAAAWLFVARRFVPYDVVAALFDDPGVPVFSALCARMLRAAYPSRDTAR